MRLAQNHIRNVCQASVLHLVLVFFFHIMVCCPGHGSSLSCCLSWGCDGSSSVAASSSRVSVQILPSRPFYPPALPVLLCVVTVWGKGPRLGSFPDLKPRFLSVGGNGTGAFPGTPAQHPFYFMRTITAPGRVEGEVLSLSWMDCFSQVVFTVRSMRK